MKRIKYTVCLGVLLLGISSSCTKNFSELNTDPNTSEKVLPENLLPRALVQSINGNLSRNRTITNELMQVTVNTLVETDRIFRYDIRRNITESPWSGWYLQLTNFKDIYRLADENRVDENASKVFKGISLIGQVWIHSIITDTFGDTPYSEANRGRDGIYAPVFDKQEDIYQDMFVKLEEANNLLKGTKNIEAKYDPLYGGSASLWRKFGNSLYLRLLMRVSGKAEVASEAVAKIQEIVDTKPLDYPIIASNAESAILRLTGVEPLISPYASLRESEWRYPKACSFFVDNLDQSADPCLSRWLTLSNGIYEGIPSAYIQGQTPEGKSYLNTTLKTDPLLGNILNYAEVQFILAEAAAKGWITTKTAQEYYEAGISARVTLWGRTVSSTYLQNSLVKWNDLSTPENKMAKIHWQKYLALLFTDMQQWIEHRRSGYPVLPKGPGLMNDGVMPTRLFYPISAQATNVKNYDDAIARQGPDDLKTIMWWQKP